MRNRRSKIRVLAIALAVGLFFAACGDDDDATATPVGGGESTSDDGAMDDMGDMDDDMGDEDMDDEHGHESFAFGEPASPEDATRTIEVMMDDSFKYDPPTIEVAAGETVLFVVTNSGKIVHEFTLGDDELQAEHEEEMADMPAGMAMADEPNAVGVEPGETKELAFTFTEPGTYTYACHQAGHFAAGMVGDITVTS